MNYAIVGGLPFAATRHIDFRNFGGVLNSIALVTKLLIEKVSYKDIVMNKYIIKY